MMELKKNKEKMSCEEKAKLKLEQDMSIFNIFNIMGFWGFGVNIINSLNKVKAAVCAIIGDDP